jgi:hypothetical protein
LRSSSLERRAISPAIATIGLISVAIAASIPAISQLQTQARNSAPDTYAVSIDMVKLSDTKAWFYVSQSEAKYICANILQDASAWGPLFCTSDKTSVTTANIVTNIGDRYSIRVDLYDAAGKVYASKNISVIVR